MKDPKQIIRHELIGKQAEVHDATNKANVGIKGKIVDETHSTITLNTEKGEKRLIKSEITIDIEIDGRKVRVDGKLLEGRAEERIKIKIR